MRRSENIRITIIAALLLSIFLVSCNRKDKQASEHEWAFTFFGVSVKETRNRHISSGEDINEDVVLASALFKEDGSIDMHGLLILKKSS